MSFLKIKDSVKEPVTVLTLDMAMRILIFLIVVFAYYGCKPTQIFDYEKTDNFTIAFGSCSHQWEEQPIWDVIAAQKPDLWIWTGDIIYADTEDMSKMKADYDLQNSVKSYSKFSKKTKVIGIWDDHDYGLNNGGKEYPKKDSSKLLLFDFLNVPHEDPSWDHDGAYQSYVFNSGSLSIKVLLLDARSFRDERGSEDGTILGNAQWQWLENEIRKNESDVHLIVSGIQIIPEDHKYEKWANIGNERQRLLGLVKDVNNPILISGDRHLAEISAIPLQSNRLVEITSSGLTHAFDEFREEVNRHRLGEVYPGINFGLLNIRGRFAMLDWHAAILDQKGEIKLSVTKN